MWEKKIFKSAEARETWYQQNKKKYQMYYIFVNNGYGIEYKPLKTIKL